MDNESRRYRRIARLTRTGRNAGGRAIPSRFKKNIACVRIYIYYIISVQLTRYSRYIDYLPPSSFVTLPSGSRYRRFPLFPSLPLLSFLFPFHLFVSFVSFVSFPLFRKRIPDTREPIARDRVRRAVTLDFRRNLSSVNYSVSTISCRAKPRSTRSIARAAMIAVVKSTR